jgi:hypothetical protein
MAQLVGKYGLNLVVGEVIQQSVAQKDPAAPA